MHDGVVFDYLNPDVPAGLRLLDIPLVRANRDTIKGYGEIVRDPRAHRVEIEPRDAGVRLRGQAERGVRGAGEFARLAVGVVAGGLPLAGFTEG